MQKDNFYKQQGRLVVPLVSGVLWSYTVNWGRPCPAAEVETRTSLLPRHNPFPGEQISQTLAQKPSVLNYVAGIRIGSMPFQSQKSCRVAEVSASVG